MRLILGSASARRRDLLAQIGMTPAEIRPADIDETPRAGELPVPYCARMAREKAAAIAVSQGEILLCADTTVALGRRILGKPRDRDEAAAFLTLLSGRRHRVTTAITVRNDTRSWHRSVTSRVRMKRLGAEELGGYLDSGDWRGKAGGYGIQGPAAAFIVWMSGSFSAIVGLPLAETAQLLKAAGYAPPAGKAG